MISYLDIVMGQTMTLWPVCVWNVDLAWPGDTFVVVGEQAL